jgi:exopolysaccharide biosynthesis WecB/TagA/CpsF family protein
VNSSTIEILGVPFTRLEPGRALNVLEALYDRAEPAVVVHANVHTVNLAYKDPSYLEALRRADLVLNDGKGVMLGARILDSSFPSDLNGNFFTPLVLERAAARGWPLFLFGAKPGVAERAAAVLVDEYKGLRVVGTQHGYVPKDSHDELLETMRASGAGLLLVGMGNPRQERWLARYIGKTGARLGIGVGAFFDFQAGELRRAPEWMQRSGLEWVHRLRTEPQRMWRRYIVGNPAFVARVLRQRLTS